MRVWVHALHLLQYGRSAVGVGLTGGCRRLVRYWLASQGLKKQVVKTRILVGKIQRLVAVFQRPGNFAQSLIGRRTLADRALITGVRGRAIEHLPRQAAILIDLILELRVLQHRCLWLLLPRGGESRLDAAIILVEIRRQRGLVAVRCGSKAIIARVIPLTLALILLQGLNLAGGRLSSFELIG